MDSPSPHEAHRRLAEDRANAEPVRCAVLTVSDTRTPETDLGGPLIVQYLANSGLVLHASAIVKDDPGEIRGQLDAWIDDLECEVIITTGGTGISRRDNTVQVVKSLVTDELEGFGELFRMLSYEQVQSAAMLSRALAGLVVNEATPTGDTFLFALPGSTNAIETAMSQLIVPQLAHLVWERRK